MMLNLPRRLRRNHALEHATINLLTQQYAEAYIVGFSRVLGFTLYTNLATADVVTAVTEALRRLKAGQHELAIHSNCGTGLIATAGLTTLGTLVSLGSPRMTLRQRIERFPTAVLINAVLILLARLLGVWLQTHVTVDPHIAAAELASVFTVHQGKLQRINVNIRYA